MILLDTHVWIWWVHGDECLGGSLLEMLKSRESEGFGVSVISCWEVAKLVEYNRLALPCPVPEWFEQALSYPGVQLLDLTPQIAYESTHLPEGFHRDPSDQIIVATARTHDISLLTLDAKILAYPHVNLVRR